MMRMQSFIGHGGLVAAAAAIVVVAIAVAIIFFTRIVVVFTHFCCYLSIIHLLVPDCRNLSSLSVDGRE